jgi:hypothetical protein
MAMSCVTSLGWSRKTRVATAMSATTAAQEPSRIRRADRRTPLAQRARLDVLLAADSAAAARPHESADQDGSDHDQNHVRHVILLLSLSVIGGVLD